MALTKVNRGGLNTGISDSSNATFLTVDSSEQAVIKSENGAVTTSVQKGLAKFLVNYDAINQTTDGSLNQSSLTDNATGNFTSDFTNNFNSAANKFFFGSVWNTANDGGAVATNLRLPGITQTVNHANTTSSLDFDSRVAAHSDGNAIAYHFSGTNVSLLGELA